MNIVIAGGRVIDPLRGLDAVQDLYIAGGFIAGLGPKPDGFKADLRLEAAGRIVCPGLIDLRARLREPGLEHKATVDSETAAAVAAGITTLCCPPDTDPPIDTPAMAQTLQSRAWRCGRSQVYPLGALTRGLAGKHLSDMAALTEAGCVGLSNGLAAIIDTQVLRRALEYAATLGAAVFLHAEDPWLAAGGCVHEGEISTRMGLPGIPAAAEAVAVARDLALIELSGVRAHFCQLSTARAVALVAEAQARGLPVTADVTAHHLHLTEHDIGYFDTHCHVRPPLRSRNDREALRAGLKSGALAAICSDHQPHEPDAKLAPFRLSEPGVSGLETLLPLTLRLVDEGAVSLSEAIALLTHRPARVLGIDAGHLGSEATADLCVFDPEASWTLDPSRLKSRGRNTPFAGWRLRGRVTHTLVGGELVFEAH